MKRINKLTFPRIFSKTDNPYAEVKWTTRTIELKSEKDTVFRQDDVEVPEDWSDRAAFIAASKYFRGHVGQSNRERSVKELFDRVVDTLTAFGMKNDYFDKRQGKIFNAELKKLLVEQRLAFNSPVFFNVGIDEKPQGSACQPYYARVMTALGPMPIGAIVENNLIGLPVYDGDGLTQVVAVKHNGQKPVFRISLQDGHRVEATGDHLVCAHNLRRTKHLEWHRTDHLKQGMVMRVYPHAAETITPSGDAREISEAALAGWLQADGFVGQYAGQSLTAEFMTNGEDEHRWVMHHLKVVLPNAHYHVSDAKIKNQNLKVRRIRLYGEALRPLIDKYGLLQRGLDIRVPKVIFGASNDAVVSYLKSVFQADGFASIHGNSAHIAVSTISEDWMRDVQVLLSRIGIYSRVRRNKERRDNRYDMWELDISIVSERCRFLHHVGFIEKRKQSILQRSTKMSGKECPDVRYSEINEISVIGNKDVYDIQTISGKYLSDNVLVHNCFVLGVDDDLGSIAELQNAETKLFSMGSGAGSNLSTLRPAGEPLSKGGWASGPLSFLRGYDGWAGIIRSGGVLRRASKMVRIDDWHPDVYNEKDNGTDFISFKKFEEKKARALFEQGFPIDTAYQTVSGQNCNISVGISDAFMRAVLEDKEWGLKWPATNNKYARTVKASDMLDAIVNGIHDCGDPGIQFDDTINNWNTCAKTGRIKSSNPCGEFLPPGEGACNLLSLNLIKFFSTTDEMFFEQEFLAAVRLAIIAQDILVDLSSYPLPRIETAAKKFRPLGLGFANLGGLLMAMGWVYDSEPSRLLASSLTALMTGQAYKTSIEIANVKGSFPELETNRRSMTAVLRKHKSALDSLSIPDAPVLIGDIYEKAAEVWAHVTTDVQRQPLRNSQVTLMAPTGTIGLMMDCATTGVEPTFLLVVNKSLVGGGSLKIVSNTIPRALETLRYSETEQTKIVHHIIATGSAEGSGIRDDDLPIFDMAYPLKEGSRCISSAGHLNMIAAIQPFVSGGISKTIGQPETVTKAEIRSIIINAWKMGIKSLTIYRDGSKITAPISRDTKSISRVRYNRERLPPTRRGEIHKFDIAGTEGYLQCGFFEDGRLGEIFITLAKEGSTMRGVMECFATAVSISLQSGVPLSVLIEKFRNVKFEPNGITRSRDPQNPINMCSSIIDYIFRYLEKFDLENKEVETPVTSKEEIKHSLERRSSSVIAISHNTCRICGSLLIREGPNCESCPNKCPGTGSGMCGG